MAIYVYWFLLALVLLGLELATGTFYLLMLSIAMAVGGVAALFGLGLILFIITFVVLSVSEWLIKQGEKKAGVK